MGTWKCGPFLKKSYFFKVFVNLTGSKSNLHIQLEFCVRFLHSYLPMYNNLLDSFTVQNLFFQELFCKYQCLISELIDYVCICKYRID